MIAPSPEQPHSRTTPGPPGPGEGGAPTPKEAMMSETQTRRAFHVYKQSDGVWAVRWGEVVISTHSTRDGAAVSCNQLNEAEGWPMGHVR